MNKLELKIRKNKLLFDQKFKNNAQTNEFDKGSIKTGFSDGWGKGWGNFGKALIIDKHL